MRRIGLFAAASLGLACFSDPGRPNIEADTGADTMDTGDESTTAGDGDGDGDGTTGDGDGTGDGTTGDGDGVCDNDGDCSGGTPYCEVPNCVACTELGVGGCADRDPALPACDSATGSCEECTDSQSDLCSGLSPVCVNGSCAACTDGAQCPTGACLPDGSCLLDNLNVQGRVYEWLHADAPGFQADQVTVTSVDPNPIDDTISTAGDYEIPDLTPFSLIDLDASFAQAVPVLVPDAVSHTRIGLSTQNVSPVDQDVPFISYAEMARIAFECGLFPTIEDATGESAGFVNTYFTSRSTIFGQLVDPMGMTLPAISRFAIDTKMVGALSEQWGNIHESIVDNQNLPATTVCFLDEAVDGTVIGTTDDTSNDTGRFVMFRVRNAENSTGAGVATVSVSGFDAATVNLPSSGNIGVVELVRNDDVITRDFINDVYPIFTRQGCIGCHTNGGPQDAMMNVLGMRNGFAADWNLPPDQVWDNMTLGGSSAPPGQTTCPPQSRVCTNDVMTSLFVTRPLADAVGGMDVHPVDIFPSLDHPDLQIIIDWISQGAMFSAQELTFVDDIYPIYSIHGCVGCHTNGGPQDAMGMTLGMRDGFAADWSLDQATVYDNMTLGAMSMPPGRTTCPDPVGNPARICTDTPLDSLHVIRPLADPPMSTDPHPVVIFPTVDHPDMQKIINWIGQGAPYDMP